MLDDLICSIDKYIEDAQELLKESWANGTFTDKDVYGTVQLNSKYIGKYQMLEEFKEFLANEKRKYNND